MKSEWWNRRAEFNVAAFHYDYRNQQFLDAFALPGGAGTGFHTVNAPKSRVDGAEFEVRAKVLDDLELRGALGLLSSKYVELTLHGVDLSGNRLIQAPNYDGSVGVDWRFAHIAAGDFKALLDANFYGKQYFDAPNTERIAQGAYGIANARISFETASSPGFAVGAWIKNIANREYLAYGLAQRDPSQGGGRVRLRAGGRAQDVRAGCDLPVLVVFGSRSPRHWTRGSKADENWAPCARTHQKKRPGRNVCDALALSRCQWGARLVWQESCP